MLFGVPHFIQKQSFGSSSLGVDLLHQSVPLKNGLSGLPGEGDLDITEIDITETAITEFDITDTAITESDITRKGKML